MFCQDWSLVKHEYHKLTILPLKCKCWTCDECRPDRTRRLIHEAKTGVPTLFITLTSRRREDITPSQAAQQLVIAWRKIRREYVKDHGKGSLPFLAVFEETKLGWPHLHIVARCRWLSQKWLSKRMGDLHGSPWVWVKPVHGVSKVAAYVSKYIGKNPHRFEGVKRYWRSLDYLKPPEEPVSFADGGEAPWLVVKKPWIAYFQEVEHRYYVEDFGQWGALLMRGIPTERWADGPP